MAKGVGNGGLTWRLKWRYRRCSNSNRPRWPRAVAEFLERKAICHAAEFLKQFGVVDMAAHAFGEPVEPRKVEGDMADRVDRARKATQVLKLFADQE